MLRPKSVVCQSRVAAVVAPLALLLSMSISHQAMAACTPVDLTGVSGIVFSCTGDAEVPADVDIDFTASTAAVNQLVKITGDETELENESILKGKISGTGITAAQSTKQLHGIRADEADGVETLLIENEGTIQLSHGGTGLVAGITAFGGAGEDFFQVVNEGIIDVTRGAQTIVNTAATFTAVPVGTPGLTAVRPSIAAGIYIHEEETLRTVIVNEEDGEITAHGQYAYGMFVRPTSLNLTNYGLISAFNASGDAENKAGEENEGAAAIVSWDGRFRLAVDPATNTRQITYGKSYIDNYGTIEGDIWVTDSSSEATTVDMIRAVARDADPFLLNPTTLLERRDSQIANFGSIEGNIYLFAGSHTLINGEGAEIDGDVFVDQRRTILYSTNNATTDPNIPIVGVAGPVAPAGDDDDDDDDEAGLAETYYNSFAALVAANPDHRFVLDNAGVIEGDVTVFTYTGTTGPRTPPSTIEIRPHILGAGGATANTASLNSGYIDDTLAIGTTTTWPTVNASTVAATTTLAPVADTIVKSNEWWLAARHLFGTQLPSVSDTVLVDWTAAIPTAGTFAGGLVVGAQVHDAASVVPGLSAPGAATINGLLQGSTDPEVVAIGAALQNSTDAEEIRKAGEQLKPETNFATQQAAWTLSFLTGNYIDNRLNGVGATGASGPGLAQAAGLGMTQTASASPAPEGRMSLGLGTNDGRMNIGANDGRMDAGIYDEADPDLRQRDYRSALWGQVFGAGLSQDERANVAGYDTHIYGAMAGVDNWIDARTRLGFAGGYGNTSIDTENPDTKKNQTEIDSYLGMIYGAYKGSGWYLSTRAGYSWHDYTTQRVVTVPVNATALGSHSGNQYMASAEVGSPLQYYGAAFTPVASVTWNRLEQDGYQESSVVGLKVASQENDSLQSGLGAKTMIQVAPGTLIEGRAIWYHEFEDTNQQVTAAFGGAANFTAAGPGVGRDTAAVGVGMFAYSEAGVSVQLNYDALLRQDFIGHTGSGRVKVEF